MFSCCVKASSTGPIDVLPAVPTCSLREGRITVGDFETRIFFRHLVGDWYEFHCRTAAIVRALWNRTNVFRAIAIPLVARNRGLVVPLMRVAGGVELSVIKRENNARYVYVERDDEDVETWRTDVDEGVEPGDE